MNLLNLRQRLRETTRLLIRKLGVLERSEALCCSVTLTQCHVIVETGRREQISVNELSELLNLDKSTVSRTVEQLVNNDILIRETDLNDRRYVALKLTGKGEELFTTIEQRMEEYFREILAFIPEGKQEQVIESLQLFSEALQSKGFSREQAESFYAIRTAVESDLPAMNNLLTENGLTTSGIRENLCNFLVAQEEKIIGVIGSEFKGNNVMLRSLAISPEVRKRGIGMALMKHSLEKARAAGMEEVYILTNTAEKFASRLGFYQIKRSEIPVDLMESSALNQFCPSSSTCMKLELKKLHNLLPSK